MLLRLAREERGLRLTHVLEPDLLVLRFDCLPLGLQLLAPLLGLLLLFPPLLLNPFEVRLDQVIDTLLMLPSHRRWRTLPLLIVSLLPVL